MSFWFSCIACCLTWLAAALVLRFSSVATLTAAVLSPIYAYFLADLQRAELAAFLALLIFIRHHQNIARLLKGQEPKIGAKKNA